MRRFTAPFLFSCTLALAACGQPAVSHAGVVQGKVVDTQGRPLAGAKVILDVWNHSDGLNTDHSTNSYDDTDVRAITNASGAYSVRVGPGGWRVYGTIERRFNGQTYSMILHPQNPAWVPGNQGGVRNLAWRLSGPIPDEMGGGYYGGTLKVVTTYESSFRDDQYPNLQVQLTPVGPLIDGSAGQVLTRRPDRDGVIQDVPIGRYTMQVRLNGRPVSMRMDDNTSPFGNTVTVDFKNKADSSWSYCTNCAQVELR